MSTGSPVAASRPLFASRGPAALTESPSHKERSLFLHSNDSAHPAAHSSPISSPRSLTRHAALQARRHSAERDAAHPTASTSTSTSGPKSADPFVLGKEGDMSLAPEKSEDGRTVLLGEGKLEGSGKSLLILATEPPAEPPADLTRVSSSRKSSDAGSPAGSRQALLQRGFHPGAKQADLDDLTGRKQMPQAALGSTPDTPAEPEKLAAPANQLVAPLDTMRPDVESSLPFAAASSAAAGVQRTGQANLLDSWSSVRSQVQGKQLVVFLDYDGTLTPIVAEPSRAIIAEVQRARLAKLATKCPVSIVTGRKVATIQKFILGSSSAPKPKLPGLEQIYFAGSHGFDIRCPPGSSHSDKQVADEFIPQLTAFYNECVEGCKGIEGALVENNTYSISVHYRNVSSESDIAKIDALVTKAIRPFELSGQLQRFAGKCVHEIRPKIDWHKGAAVHYLLNLIFPALLRAEGSDNALRLPGGRELCPVYFGDDTTDEDAFRLLQQYGGSDASIKALSVFVRSDDKARPSAANFVLRSPEEVGHMLEKLAELAQ